MRGAESSQLKETSASICSAISTASSSIAASGEPSSPDSQLTWSPAGADSAGEERPGPMGVGESVSSEASRLLRAPSEAKLLRVLPS